ncbi:hypothetical protein NQ315_012608 [Exocentrus adspersus]|uniref:Uncharacterized protein n=1 Tax=Exocentrus adspersus TaxID=1586481 RepID=A0AAV8VRT5_9CUCU|nr:hypothetical protein NQ315_012608 [Exocentrus adspersus]
MPSDSGSVRCHNGVYDRLAIHIPNLSEPNNTYRSSEPSSATFNKIITDLKIDKKTTQSLVVINKIQNALQKHIDTVVQNLSEAESQLYELEEEVKQLEIMQKLKKLNNDERESDNTEGSNETSSQSAENSPVPERKVNNRIDSSSDESPTRTVKKTPVGRRVRGKRKAAETS